MRTQLGRCLILVTPIALLLGSTIADRDCQFKICGQGSKRCTGSGGICTFCDGIGTTDMCFLVLGLSCTHTNNFPCGNTYEGTCTGVAGGTYGKCVGSTLVNSNCNVLQC